MREDCTVYLSHISIIWRLSPMRSCVARHSPHGFLAKPSFGMDMLVHQGWNIPVTVLVVFISK